MKCILVIISFFVFSPQYAQIKIDTITVVDIETDIKEIQDRLYKNCIISLNADREIKPYKLSISINDTIQITDTIYLNLEYFLSKKTIQLDAFYGKEFNDSIKSIVESSDQYFPSSTLFYMLRFDNLKHHLKRVQKHSIDNNEFLKVKLQNPNAIEIDDGVLIYNERYEITHLGKIYHVGKPSKFTAQYFIDFKTKEYPYRFVYNVSIQSKGRSFNLLLEDL